MKRMIPFLIALICFLLVILEGTLAQVSLPFLKDEWINVSHFLFIFLLYVTIFFEKESTYYAIALSIIFSLINDIVYTDVIGVYVFAYTAVLYAARVLMKLLQSNFLIALLMTAAGVVVTDILIFFLYNIIQVHVDSWSVYWQNRLIPTSIWNILFGLLIYLIFAKKLTKWSYIKFERAD
ncbi:rod shape-determining protein MreD [Gracilibacillus thailandensis]|uniref:Rod shape-determining protein MreD n=1 Tax=Gracilibacillus thailandensis TaxID=563735 RepID=A0A6N7R228_9BACI|nr:rod shape-determining protein MreD [Gracilibacillus thailandensis]MRI67605.1 rod shape-determining protein MreD [Gracilibacillus thailandensis]